MEEKLQEILDKIEFILEEPQEDWQMYLEQLHQDIEILLIKPPA